MEKFNLSTIPRSQIHSLAGEVSYTVLHLHKSRSDQTEPPIVPWNCYFMRTAPSIDEAVEQVTAEFKRPDLTQERFTPNYSTGLILFQDSEIIVKPTPESIKGMNFWVPEGLIWEYLKEEDDTPKIKTDRVPTKKLFKSLSALHETVESNMDLATLLTDPKRSCTINLVKIYKDYLGLDDAARGHDASKIAIMNRGGITQFKDPETGLWYLLLNKDVPDGPPHLPKGIIQETGGGSFRHLDQVPDRYFFDGTMNDIFEILQNKGIKLS